MTTTRVKKFLQRYLKKAEATPDVALPWLSPWEQPLLGTRYFVLDLESDGLQRKNNRILSVGAIAVVEQSLCYGEAFYHVLQHTGTLQADAMLIHGLSPNALQQGDNTAEVLQALCEHGQQSVWVGFHAGFDALLLQQAFESVLQWPYEPQSLNVAEYLPALFPDKASAQHSLDDWVEHFALQGIERHNALGDAMVTAELLLIALRKASQLGLTTWGEVRQLRQQQQKKRGY